MLTDKPLLTLGDDSLGSSYHDTYAPPAVPDISGPEKAAVLMITIGLELSASIFKFLRQDEVERIVLEIAKISTVSIEKRDAVIQKTAPEILEQLDELLGRRLLVSGSDFTKAGGVQSLAAVMGFVDRETEKNILDGLTKRDPDVANEVKNLLFVFEDIISLDDRAIQRVLKEVDGKDLALSLKTARSEE